MIHLKSSIHFVSILYVSKDSKSESSRYQSDKPMRVAWKHISQSHWNCGSVVVLFNFLPKLYCVPSVPWLSPAECALCPQISDQKSIHTASSVNLAYWTRLHVSWTTCHCCSNTDRITYICYARTIWCLHSWCTELHDCSIFIIDDVRTCFFVNNQTLWKWRQR